MTHLQKKLNFTWELRRGPEHWGSNPEHWRDTNQTSVTGSIFSGQADVSGCLWSNNPDRGASFEIPQPVDTLSFVLVYRNKNIDAMDFSMFLRYMLISHAFLNLQFAL